MDVVINSQGSPVHGDLDELLKQFMIIDMDEKAVADLNLSNKAEHRHAYHEIIWVRQGSAVHVLDGESLDFPRHTLVCIPASRIHKLYPSPDCKTTGIKFKKEFLQLASHMIFSQHSAHTVIQMNQEQAAIIEGYIGLMHYEYNHPSSYSHEKLQHLVSVFIIFIEELRLFQSQSDPKNLTQTQSMWARFNAILEEKFKTEHRVSFYALRLNVSTRKLGEIVKYYTGKCVSEVIDERLIVEARRLILISDLSIKEIAFELGFGEHSYFTKVFKKLTGITPTEFKPTEIDSLVHQFFCLKAPLKEEDLVGTLN